MLRFQRVLAVGVITSLIWTLLAPASRAVEVPFYDPNLEMAVRDTLGIQPSDSITDTDMLTMTRLFAISHHISELQGLEYATNLNHLNLRFNNISDLTPLAGLTNLNYLNLEGNLIGDLFALIGLNNLDDLNLGNNYISNVSALAELTHLNSLSLRDNSINIMDLRGADFSSLQYFDIANNPLTTVILADATLTQNSFNRLMFCQDTDTKGIAEMESVWSLNMSGVDFSSISSLFAMFTLDGLERLSFSETFNLSGNEIVTLTNELESLNWLNVAGLWNSLDLGSRNSLSNWGAIEGNTLVTQVMVTFLDTNLETAVRNRLGIPAPTDILDTDMQTMTDLDANSQGIQYLNGLKYATNLRSLSLAGNQISDISELSRLTYMRWMNLGNNQISDITTLAELTWLEDLKLGWNQISDISALAGLTNLSGLDLTDNQHISDISALAGLTNMKWLSLGGNQISDISALAGLTNMSGLGLGNNQISDISAVAGLTDLELLDLRDNQISNISAVAGLNSLFYLNLYNNQITDISPVAGLTGLTLLHFEYNQISDISPVAGLTNLTELGLSCNQITDISAVAGLSHLLYLNLYNNQITDISAVAGLTNLEFLDLKINQISNISAVAGLTNLNDLGLSYNQITDISAVVGLSKLTELSLNDNQIGTMNFRGANFPLLSHFNIGNNPLTNVVLAEATLTQSSFDVLMTGGDGRNSGIAYVDGVLSLDLSGVDFSGILDFSTMYTMDALQELLLVGATGLPGSQVVAMTNELDSLNWLDVTGLWNSFDSTSQSQLTAWDAISGNTLIMVTQLLPGDANRDGVVDGSDATILAGYWQVGIDGTQHATWDMGDFNDDGCVDGSDATILAGYWQQSVGTPPTAAVPEPSTLVMLLVMAASAVLWRKPRKI